MKYYSGKMFCVSNTHTHTERSLICYSHLYTFIQILQKHLPLHIELYVKKNYVCRIISTLIGIRKDVDSKIETLISFRKKKKMQLLMRMCVIFYRIIL